MSTTMRLADLMRDYEDGDRLGWPVEFPPLSVEVVRRRKAGPWEPVKGDET